MPGGMGRDTKQVWFSGTHAPQAQRSDPEASVLSVALQWCHASNHSRVRNVIPVIANDTS